LKSKGILPDTCVWVDYFRPGTTPLGQRLEQALADEVVYVCGPVLYELVQGAKSDEEQVSLTHAMAALPFLDVTEKLWIQAGKLAAALRREGKTIPLSDILIAAITLEHNLVVLTADEHFRIIPGVVVDA
jgi:predicted nucleic acid-binding protein